MKNNIVYKLKQYDSSQFEPILLDYKPSAKDILRLAADYFKAHYTEHARIMGDNAFTPKEWVIENFELEKIKVLSKE